MKRLLSLASGWSCRAALALALVTISALPVCAQNVRDALGRPDSWFRTEEAKKIAENVLSYQSDWGGWLKNTNTAAETFTGTQADLHPTFDNGATITEMRFLAKMYAATKEEKYLTAFQRALDYVLVAQYGTGGWPQSYPPAETYHGFVTFNDNAMARVMGLLRDIYTDDDFNFLPAERRAAARSAYDRGIQFILKAQVKVDGKLTGWGAQHDPYDYRPRYGRPFELTSLSGQESVEVVRLLMEAPPSPEIEKAIEAAIAWFKDAAMDEAEGRKAGIKGKPTPIWGRFIEIETNRPLFSNRQSEVKYNYMDLEDRESYHWVGTWPVKLLEQDYPAWKKRGKKPQRDYKSSIQSYEPALRLGLAGDMSVTDREGWAFGLKKALTNRALYFEFAGGAGTETPAPAPKAGAKIAEADSSRGAFLRRVRPALGSEAWWQQVTQAQPDFLLITFSRKDDSEGRGSDIKKIIERAKAAKIQSVLVTPVPKVSAKGKDGIDLDTDPAAQTIARVAKETNTPLIDLHTIAKEQLPKLDPATARTFFVATAEGYSADLGTLTPWGKEEFGALVGGNLLKGAPNFASRLGLQQPALVSRMATGDTPVKMVSAPRQPPVSAQKAIRERFEAAAARHRAAQAANQGPKIESEPMLLVVNLEGGKLEVRRALSAVTSGGTVLAKLADGTQAAWSLPMIRGQLPWYPDPASRGNVEELRQTAAKYEASAKSYPEIRADLEAEATALREVVSQRERRAAMEQKLAAIRYEPAKNYNVGELRTLLDEAAAIRSALPPEREAKVRAAIEPFRVHLARLEAGDRLIDGAWQTKDEIEVRQLAETLSIPVAGQVLAPDRLLKALMIPGLVIGGVLLAGIVLACLRSSRGLGVTLLVLVVAAGAFLVFSARPKPAAKTAATTGDSQKIARLHLAGSRGIVLPGDGTEITLTEADVDAFLAKHLTFAGAPDSASTLRRTDLGVDLKPNALVVQENLMFGFLPLRADYFIKIQPAEAPASPGMTLQSLNLGSVPVPKALQDALWASLREQAAAIVTPILHARQVSKIDRQGVVLAPATGSGDFSRQDSPRGD